MNNQLTIAHIFPALLSTYGDAGNVSVLRHRAESRGIRVAIVDVLPGDPVPATADLYVIGGGEDAQEMRATELLREDSGLSMAVHRGAPVLAVCAGMQILGEWFTDGSDSRVIGLGLLDLRTERRSVRAVGDVIADATGVPDLPTLIGFENHRGATSLGSDARPLARVLHGIGNGAAEPVEGALQGSIIGTYLHGPVLALNSGLADHLLAVAVGQLAPMNDMLAEEFRANRFQRARA
ncbi:MAG: glutamine amidotransferase [Actinobacteria bacterium]|nr:glutamine amidotransferase [Actinomycetota bacterium]